MESKKGSYFTLGLRQVLIVCNRSTLYQSHCRSSILRVTQALKMSMLAICVKPFGLMDAKPSTPAPSL